MSCPPVHRTTMKELERQFKQFDTDGDGEITFGKFLLDAVQLGIE